VVYRITGADGQPVYSGGEAQASGPLENAIAPLGPEGYRVNVLPPGHYQVAWQVYGGPPAGDYSASANDPLVASGHAEVEVSSGETATVNLQK
jgi:hypothetical protein